MVPPSRTTRSLLAAGLFLVLSAASSRAQQIDVPRYDLYAGFAGFETPELNLAQRGFHVQAGENVRTWLSVGFDYSEGSGHNALTPNLLKASLQQELGGEIRNLILAGLIPANYQLVVPTDAFSQTFAFGPQLAYRRMRPATLFVRPSLGAIRQRVTPKPGDPVATAIVAQLVPAGGEGGLAGLLRFRRRRGMECDAAPRRPRSGRPGLLAAL